MSEGEIRNNWETIKRDRDNPRPDIEDIEEWIALAKSGKLLALGATIMIQNEMPKFGGKR